MEDLPEIDLVRIVDEEMDGVAHEQRQRLETIEGEHRERQTNELAPNGLMTGPSLDR